ncbi:hypothetical protein NMY22_g17362 [Coprinellus aureogranulatus]|nr:hypothetical protein NMY22_g17362 [Coprinellus aureogranulatus]
MCIPTPSPNVPRAHPPTCFFKQVVVDGDLIKAWVKGYTSDVPQSASRSQRLRLSTHRLIRALCTASGSYVFLQNNLPSTPGFGYALSVSKMRLGCNAKGPYKLTYDVQNPFPLRGSHLRGAPATSPSCVRGMSTLDKGCCPFIEGGLPALIVIS